MNPRPQPPEPATGVDLAHEARFQLGRTEVRPATLELVREGVSATVERKVMQALVVLARRTGEVTSRDELVQHVWSGRFIGEDAIHRVIAKLRQAAEGHCAGDFSLDTIPRVGYRLIVAGTRDTPTTTNEARWRPGRRTWTAVAAALVVVALAGVATLRWWPQPEPRPPALRLAGLAALGPGVPATLPASLTDDIRTAFGKDNVVMLREQDPEFVLNGNVRRVDDKLQLTVRLFRDGAMLWSGVREWPVTERVSPRYNAAGISQVIRCGLLDGGTQLPDHALATYLQYCEARLWPLAQPERSVAFARRLVQQQPGFSQGWSALAWTAERTRAFDPARADADALRAEAGAAAAKALKLDPRNAQAYEAQAHQLPESAYAERERLLLRASQGRLTACGCEVVAYGGALIAVGRVREAVVQYERAHQREPLGPHALNLAMGYATLNDAERSDRAFATWSEVYADTPDFLAISLLRAVYAGRWSEAARLVAITARPERRAALVSAFEALASGDPARIAAAQPAVRSLAASAPAPYTAFYAVTLAAMNDRPAALDKLETVTSNEIGLLYHPAILAALRHEPRYLQLLERHGLTRYWRETGARPDICLASDPPAFCKTL